MTDPITPMDKSADPAHVSDAGSQNRTSALAALHREINDHLNQQLQESYLDKIVSFVTTPFHHEDQTLKTAQQVYDRARKDTNVSQAEISTVTMADKKATSLHQNIDQIGGEVIKTGALFLGKRAGLAAAVISFGLSQAKPGESASAQGADMLLGALKGGATQQLFSKIGNVQMNFAAKGVLMGTTSRSIDLGLTRSTWTDPTSGTLSLDHAVSTLRAGAINKSALVSDIVVFGVAGGLSSVTNRLTSGALERSPFLATTLTGATFGATSGAYNEYLQQQQKNEKFDLSKIIGAAALHGTVNGIAAIPGALRGAPTMRLELGDKLAAAGSSLMPRSNISLAESVGLPSAGGLKPALAFAGASSRQFELQPLRPAPSVDVTGPGRVGEVQVGETTKVGGQTPDSKAGGEGPAVLGRATESASQNVTIFAALKGVPEADRLAVWKQQIASGRDANLVAASNAIDLLPARDTFAAVEHTIKTAPEHANFMLGKVSPEQVPDLTRSIFANTSGQQRTDLLNLVYVGDSSPAAVESTFKAASGASGQDLDAVRSWFRDLPEPPAQWSRFKAPTPVRDALTNNLDPQFLGRMLFEGRENGVDVNRLSLQDPQLVRKLAQVTDLSAADHMQNVSKVVSKWQSSASLEASTKEAIALSAGARSGAGIEALPDVLGELATRASGADVSAAIDQLREAAIGSTGGKSESQVWLAATSAARLARTNPAQAEAGFFKPVVEALSDRNMDYNWRLSTARILSNLERIGDLPEGAITLPELRMPALSGLSDSQKSELRTESEATLRGDKPLSNLLGDGALGKLFPQVFGSEADGGIVGRPQHEAHDYTVDKHTESVLQRVRENPQFDSLSAKDQTNLLWASLLHDVGKRPGIVDPGHEAISANISWGVLRTLGYSPSRIARITNLISSHSDLGFQPEHPTAAKLADQEYLDQAAVKYNHPAAATQLRILNESDIRSVQANDGLWSDTIGSQLDQLTQRVGAGSQALAQTRVPILTTDLPQHSGLFNAPEGYAVIGHVTPHLESTFFGKLPLLESPQSSLSGSLLTADNSVLFNPEARLVPLFQGAPESVSQAYRATTGSGEATGWQGHVDLFKDWPTRSEAHQMAGALEKPLADLGFGTDQGSALDNFRRYLSDFDTLNELTATTGPNSALSQGYQEVLRALTTDGAGDKITSENEVKLNNPTLVGLGVYRRGQTVALAGASASDLASILHGMPAPDWLDTSANGSGNSLVIPKSVWSQLQAHDLPIVVMDP